MLSSLWQKFLTEQLRQKLYFLFPEILTSKQMRPVFLIHFLVKNIEEKEIELLKKRLCQKLLSNDDKNWAGDQTDIKL